MDVPAFLSHLRRDRRGLPVPYINVWGPGEDVSRFSIRYDRHVQRDGVYLSDLGDVPDFTRQSPQRQRECAIEGLCQVCARAVPWSRRFLVLADMAVQRITLGRQQPQVFTEPWLDERCGTFAVQHCPALIRRLRGERLQLVAVTSQRQARIVTSIGWVDGPLEEQSRRNPPAMWCKIELRA